MVNCMVSNLKLFFMVAFSLMLLSACADRTQPGYPEVLDEQGIEEDPLEDINRISYGFNTALDYVLVQPVTTLYREAVPEFGRERVTNVLSNLGETVTFANSIMQGDVDNSFATFWRFIINTTFGLAGINDVAQTAGLSNRNADFGQTMAVWGVPSGPFMYYPIIGPSTSRDGLGMLVDMLFRPTTWTNDNIYPIVRAGFTAVDVRSNNWDLINDVYSDSLDPYATFRSAYLQRRTAFIDEGRKAFKKNIME